jgi:hypothetical protein
LAFIFSSARMALVIEERLEGGLEVGAWARPDAGGTDGGGIEGGRND